MTRYPWRQEWNAATNRSPEPAPGTAPAGEPQLRGPPTADTAAERVQLARNYAAQLRRALGAGCSPELADCAAKLGQRAIGLGLGLPELLQLHRQALAGILAENPEETDTKPADDLLALTLVPYETAYRDQQLATSRLRYRLLLQQQRLQDLAATQATLHQQLDQHRQAAANLRQQLTEQEGRFTQLLALQEELKKLCTQVLMLHETEQKRLSQELERRVSSWLDIVDDALAAVAGRCRDARAVTALAGPRRQLRRAAKAARHLAEELYPPVLENMSLAFGLRECLTAFEQRTGARTSFNCSGNFQRVDSPARLLLYRIAHELFSCPLLSEQPERVEMSLHQVNGSIQMQIKLTGPRAGTQANPATSAGPPSQFWLLQQRVRLLNGQFSANTDSGPTALVRVSLPLSPHPRDPRPG